MFDMQMLLEFGKTVTLNSAVGKITKALKSLTKNEKVNSHIK